MYIYLTHLFALGEITHFTSASVCVCWGAVSACYVPILPLIYFLSTMSGLRLDLHCTINRKSNDLSEMDHPSYCDSLMQPPDCTEEMELNYCLNIDLKLSEEAALSPSC